MKILVPLVVVIFATCSNAHHLGNITLHGKNITEAIEEEGYPVQNATVETRDGYLLDVIRIPGPQSYRHEFENALKSHKRVQTNKPVVLLMHGLLGSADDFVVGGHTRGLAYKLADNGFDVFIGSARGSHYGRKHKHLNPQKDAHFWKFCWDHIGKVDLPAIIDEVLEMSGQDKLHYIGHNQGSTVFYVLASEKPEYNSKVDKMIALGPLVYLEHAEHPLMSVIKENVDSPAWVLKHMGKNEFSPSNSLRAEGRHHNSEHKDSDSKICDNVYFLVNGYSEHFNKTIAHEIVESYPDGASTRQLLHYAQLIKSGRFVLYDGDDDDDSSSDSDSSSNDNSSDDEEYNLRKVSVSNYIFYVPDDVWYNEEDIITLAEKLPNVVEKVKFPQYSSNVDLLIAKDAHHHVHHKIVQILEEEQASGDRPEM